MNIRNEDGAITIYLTIIFLVVLALVGALVDGARVRVGETQVSRVAGSAAMSTLAGYYNPLKEDYGLFALSYTDENVLLGEVENYLHKNLMTELGQDNKGNNEGVYEYLKGYVFDDEFKAVNFINLFDYRLDDTSVEQLLSLTENAVMRKQILEFMKYRAPIELYGVASDRLASISDKMEAIKNMGKTADALSRKMKLDKIGWELAVLQGQLLEETEYVNKFPHDYHGRNSKYRDLRHYFFDELRSEYVGAASAYIQSQDEDESNEESWTKPRDRRDLDRAFENINNNLRGNENLNNNAIAIANKITNKVEQLKQEIKDYEEYLENEKDNLHDSNKKMIEGFDKDVDRYKNVVKTEGDQSKTIKQALEDNVAIINNIRLDFYFIDGEVDNYYQPGQLTEKINQVKDEINKYKNNISYNVYKDDKKPSNPEGLEDVRDQVNEDLKSFEEDEKKSKDIKDIKEKLPSYKDEKGQYPNKIVTSTTLLVSDEVEPFNFSTDYELGKSREFKEEDMEAPGNFLKSMSNFASAVGKGTVTARDELYVNEYIMGMLTNNVPQLFRTGSNGIDENTDPYVDTSKDLMNKVKGSERTAYFEKGEVEYVIWGLESEGKNINATKATLGTLRFTSNLIALHNMPLKVAAADAIAVEVGAGLALISGGVLAGAIPAIREAILAGWAMAEAYVDVNHIMEGGSIPLYKDDDTWITPSLTNKAKIEGEKDLLALSYHDYLRIMLLITPEEKKMNRLQDIIQINLTEKGNQGFMLKDYYTQLGLKVDVSMRYLFMTRNFMPKSKNTEDGKHKIRTLIYEGY